MEKAREQFYKDIGYVENEELKYPKEVGGGGVESVQAAVFTSVLFVCLFFLFSVCLFCLLANCQYIGHEVHVIVNSLTLELLGRRRLV